MSIVVDATGLDHPLVPEVIRLVTDGERAPGEREALRNRLLTQAHEYRERTGALLRENTPEAAEEAARMERIGLPLLVLGEALGSPAVSAAEGAAMTAIRLNLRDRTDVMRLIVLRNLLRHIEYRQRRS
ncbi:hypothetical protein GCM10010106_33700 [Thermopolyspora flexuosa]|uniref:Uncharacterized protein n=1 Tax=Thermopolyspora flexuosa TaxID=103836 RepID=A0A543ITA5_9ACTN|nr:hypothetical protein [Thermopolyspora flexuosa]TQM73808.1 hypothetical protein FHX40_0462 [Thermopolyspora flexuosa]GGM84252.1 hypothetical protein GCM10010106_33700 [Thermopolyspora flexuosa]